MEPLRSGSSAERIDLWHEDGLSLRWVEVIRFISESDAEVLTDIRAGSYPELITGLGILHFVLTGGEQRDILTGFTSRAAQALHEDVRSLLRPIGDTRPETAERLMDPSELPFVVVGSIDDDPQRAARRGAEALGRDVTGATTSLVERGWDYRVWNDAVVCSTTPLVQQRYRLANRSGWVVWSFILDGLLVRLAQQQALGMLARRTADGATSADRQARVLHGAALRVRSRLWWPRVSPEPIVEAPSGAITEIWDLQTLADSIFGDVTGLAQHADLVAAERLNRILFVLTAGAFAVAAISLAVQIAASSDVASAAFAVVSAALISVVTSIGVVLVRRRRTGPRM